MTYSLAALVGYPVAQALLAESNDYYPKTHTVSDNVINSPAAEQQAMQLNTPFLAKGPDGQQAWYVYDAELSVPGVQRVLRRV